MSLLTKFAASRKIQKLASAARAIRKYRSMHKVASDWAPADPLLRGYESPHDADIYQPSVADWARDDYLQVRKDMNDVAEKYMDSVRKGRPNEKYYNEWLEYQPHFRPDGSYYGGLGEEFSDAIDAQYEGGPLEALFDYADMGRLGANRPGPAFLPPYKEAPNVRFWDENGKWIPQMKSPVNPKLPLFEHGAPKINPVDELNAYTASQYKLHSKQPTFLKLKGQKKPKTKAPTPTQLPSQSLKTPMGPKSSDYPKSNRFGV